MPSVAQPDLASNALLSTKLFVPQAHPAIVHRPRLVARLVEGMSRRLTVISAPPGAGKTTLIAEWHATEQGRGLPLAWLTLDERDNDPRRFSAYVVAAISKVFPDAAADFDALIQAASAVEIDHTLVLLLNLLNTLDRRFALVIDDYQMIDSPAIHTAMDYLIANAPATLRLIIASRTAPPLSLSRLRVRNQLVEIRTQDLRFTPDEVETLLRDVAGFDAAGAEAQLLTSRTDGWAAGLQLAILSLRGGGSLDEQLREFGGSNRFVADYLLEEVINRQPAEIRDFMARTSMLDRFTAELCDAVTGSDCSAEHLHFMEQGNLFLIPLDSDRRWFRYHALFQELLQHQLADCCPEDRATLLRRASEWFRAAGIGSEAVEYALRAGDVELAATILDDDDVALQALDRGELATVLRWLDAIGDETRYRHPKLNGVVLWSLISSGRIGEIEPYLNHLIRFVEEPDRTDYELQIGWGIIYAGQTALAVHRRDYAETIRLSDEALARLTPEFPISVANTLYSRGFALGLTGDLAGSVAAFRQAIDVLGPDGSAPFLMLTHTAYAQALIHKAELGTAEEVLRALLAHVRTVGLGDWSYVGFIHICLARVLYEQGLLDEALGEAERGVRMATRWASGTFELDGHFTVAMIQAARGNAEAARAELLDARKLVPVTGPNPLLARLEALQHRCDESANGAAASWAVDLIEGIPDDPVAVWPWLAAYRTAIGLALEGGAVPEACRAAGKLLVYARERGWSMAALQLQVFEARCLWMAGDRAGAVQVIAPAVERASQAGVVQPFVEGGPTMSAILSQLELEDDRIAWRSRVLAGIGAPAASEAVVALPAKSPASELIEPLSSRELEVLEQIMLGKSNGQIALDLFIAEGTVKRHTHNIYAKLAVNSRTRAIARATELGLLPTSTR